MEVVWWIAYRAAQSLEIPWQILDTGAYGGSKNMPMAGCLVVHNIV
jgi:hypothetical protein